MAYTKPQVIAQNASSGSYAAGCPANKNARESGWGSNTSAGKGICASCERTA